MELYMKLFLVFNLLLGQEFELSTRNLLISIYVLAKIHQKPIVPILADLFFFLLAQVRMRR